MADIIHEIRERRVLPAVGVYVGGCWVLIEILDRLVDRYLLSPYLTDIAFWGLYSLIPAVILVAWTHGRPGKDRATRAEKVGVPINLIATVGLLVTAFGGKDLGAAANLVTVANEEGVQESHYIPTESFRRRMAIFFFTNDSGDPELDWLQYGVTHLLVQDLQQNPFVLASSPWANFGNGFYARMKQAGFDDGLGIPRSLMREIASDANRQYFVEGSVGRQAEQYVLTARVWETQNLQQVAELTETGWDLYGTVDALSLALRDALDVPRVSGRIAGDMPLVETYGESQQALRKFIDGLNERLFRNDFDAANARLDEALAADPDFVMAWMVKALNHANAGDLPSSRAAVEAAEKLDYRLPERERATLKTIKYQVAGQNDKLVPHLRMQAQLRDDAASHASLAVALMITGQLEAAKEEFLAALEKDPLNMAIYPQLSLLERATGNMDGAIGYAREYQEEKPDDYEAHLVLGDLLREKGDLDAADGYYLQASLVDDRRVLPVVRMADIAARKGETNTARELLEQAEEIAETPTDKAIVRASASGLETRLGRLRAAIEQNYRLEEFVSQTQTPFVVAQAVYMPIVQHYCSLGEPDKAQQALDMAKGMVQPPMDQFLAFGEASIRLSRDDFEGMNEAIARGIAIIEQFNFEDLLFQADLINGYAMRKLGDYAASAKAFEAARSRVERAVIGGSNLYQLMPSIHAELAASLVQTGAMDEADKILARGFEIDPSEPLLWVSKARFQLASGLPQLAQASLGYALAIWKDADPDYRELIRALELQAEIRQAL